MNELRKRMMGLDELREHAHEANHGITPKQLEYIESMLLDVGLYERQAVWLSIQLGRPIQGAESLSSHDAGLVIPRLQVVQLEVQESRCWGPSGLDGLEGCIERE